jgi:hypothetical protein
METVYKESPDVLSIYVYKKTLILIWTLESRM